MSWLSKATKSVGTNARNLIRTDKRMLTPPTGAGIPNPPMQDPNADQSKINQFMTDTQNRYTQQQQMMKDMLNKYRQNAMTQLTTGPEGEAFRQKYNSMGLLNSGAFNTGLANQFSNIENQSELGLMNQGLNTTDTLQGIAQSGLERNFGIEDQNFQAQLQRALAKARMKQQQQGALYGLAGTAIGSFGGPLGSWMGGQIGDMFGGGGGGDAMSYGPLSLYQGLPSYG